MGTTFYFARPDNKTLFDMDKAFGLWELLRTDRAQQPTNLDDFEAALSLWLKDNEPYARAVSAAVRKFADGNPVHFISEHHPWFDDMYDNDGRMWPVVGDRFHVQDD
jgi:hypothetical protein